MRIAATRGSRGALRTLRDAAYAHGAAAEIDIAN